MRKLQRKFFAAMAPVSYEIEKLVLEGEACRTFDTFERK